MRIKMKRFLGLLLSLALVLGLIPGMILTAYAATDTYTNLIPTNSDTNSTNKVVSFNNYKWCIIEDASSSATAGTVTLVATDEICRSVYSGTNSKYSTSVIKTYFDDLVTTGSFAGVAEAIATTTLPDADNVSVKLYILSENELNGLSGIAKKCNVSNNFWWLRTPSGDDRAKVAYSGGTVASQAYLVASSSSQFGVRPALKLDLSKVQFKSVTLGGGENAIASGGNSVQNFFHLNDSDCSSIAEVTYTANSGYMFPETSEYYTTTNGITVARTSDTEVTVSGTPTGVADITVPDASLPPAAVTKAPAAKDLTYTGSAQELVTAGTASGGTMQYALGTDDKTAPTEGWSSSIPTGTNAGTYYVWYMAKGDDTHSDTDPAGPVTVTIAEAKGDYSVKSSQGTEHVLGEDKDAVYTVTNSADDKRAFDRFQGVAVDGKALGKDDYDAASGSLVLTLKSAFLNTLTAGEHAVKLTFEDGELDASLKILDPKPTPTPEPTPTPTPTPAPTPTPKPVPKTGDQDHPGLWIILMLIGIAGLTVLGTTKVSRKRK